MPACPRAAPADSPKLGCMGILFVCRRESVGRSEGYLRGVAEREKRSVPKAGHFSPLWFTHPLGCHSNDCHAGLDLPFVRTPLFCCAVMLSSRFGRMGPGQLATALSILAVAYFFVPPTRRAYRAHADRLFRPPPDRRRSAPQPASGQTPVSQSRGLRESALKYNRVNPSLCLMFSSTLALLHLPDAAA